ncbi:MAG: serine/threonine-protein kinase [Actinomadura sp.]
MYGGLELANRYRLGERLGRGGMGEVWEGIDLRLRRPVAVKLLQKHPDSDPAGAVRFRREAEASARVGHPSITILYDIDEHQGMLFLVMELLDGDDLRRVMDHEPLGLPIGETLAIAVQVADGLAAAHTRGVVHRDVKPANLVRLADGTVKICDFGIAWFAESTVGLTNHGLLGTPAYMAPEQFSGGAVDGRTDLYALGCVLQVLLTGRPPFAADVSVAEQMFNHLNTAPVGPRALRPDVPEELDALVLSLLAKDLAVRPASAHAVTERLREILDLGDTVTRAASGQGWSGPGERLAEFVTLYIVNGFRRGHDRHTVYSYLARSDASWSVDVARRVLGRVRPALVRAGAPQDVADTWARTLADFLSSGRFGADLGAGFRRETRHSVPATVEFELRLLNSAGRGGEPDGSLLLTQTDRDRLKHIQAYTEWLLAESMPPSTGT